MAPSSTVATQPSRLKAGGFTDGEGSGVWWFCRWRASSKQTK